VGCCAGLACDAGSCCAPAGSACQSSSDCCYVQQSLGSTTTSASTCVGGNCCIELGGVSPSSDVCCAPGVSDSARCCLPPGYDFVGTKGQPPPAGCDHCCGDCAACPSGGDWCCGCAISGALCLTNNQCCSGTCTNNRCG
jgi:hypothetical protein